MGSGPFLTVNQFLINSNFHHQDFQGFDAEKQASAVGKPSDDRVRLTPGHRPIKSEPILNLELKT